MSNIFNSGGLPHCLSLKILLLWGIYGKCIFTYTSPKENIPFAVQIASSSLAILLHCYLSLSSSNLTIDTDYQQCKWTSIGRLVEIDRDAHGRNRAEIQEARKENSPTTLPPWRTPADVRRLALCRFSIPLDPFLCVLLDSPLIYLLSHLFSCYFNSMSLIHKLRLCSQIQSMKGEKRWRLPVSIW